MARCSPTPQPKWCRWPPILSTSASGPTTQQLIRLKSWLQDISSNWAHTLKRSTPKIPTNFSQHGIRSSNIPSKKIPQRNRDAIIALPTAQEQFEQRSRVCVMLALFTTEVVPKRRPLGLLLRQPAMGSPHRLPMAGWSKGRLCGFVGCLSENIQSNFRATGCSAHWQVPRAKILVV